MSPEQAAAIAEAWVDAWNRHDLDRILAHYDEEVEMTSPFIAEVAGDPRAAVRGKPALRAYWRQALARFPDLHFELIGVYPGADGLVIHYRSVRGLLACEALTIGAGGLVVRAAAHYAAPAAAHYAAPADCPAAPGPRILDLLETALSVAEPAASADFYRRLFGFETLLQTDRLVALGVAGRDVLLLFREGATSEPLATPGGVIPGHGTSGPDHLAFRVPADDLPAWRARLESEAVPIESVVDWPAGVTSVYFRDPDGHLVELITPGFWPFRAGRHAEGEGADDGRLP